MSLFSRKIIIWYKDEFFKDEVYQKIIDYYNNNYDSNLIKNIRNSNVETKIILVDDTSINFCPMTGNMRIKRADLSFIQNPDKKDFMFILNIIIPTTFVFENIRILKEPNDILRLPHVLLSIKDWLEENGICRIK